jgi:Family of unknown function (DUF6152)
MKHTRSFGPLMLTLLAPHAGNAFAHHSPAAFDLSIVRDVQGTVKDVAWRNPHVYFTVETIDGCRTSR